VRYRWRRFGCAALYSAGKLLTGNIGSLLKALRAPSGSTLQYIKYYLIILLLTAVRTWQRPYSIQAANIADMAEAIYRPCCAI
jgi:hypothetical protein